LAALEHLNLWGVSHQLSKKRKSDAKVNDRRFVNCFNHSSNGANYMKPANHDANTPAVNTPNTPPNPGAPVAGCE
jgi:hypothetical protein